MKYLLEYACISSVGKCRINNQDNFSCAGIYLKMDHAGTNEPLYAQIDVQTPRLFGVFDGMGGEEHGEIAAFLASKKAGSLSAFSDMPADDLIRFCKDANEEICRYAAENQIPAMGTTAAILLFDGKRFFLCNIGDSKIFRYSENGLEQLSEDHLGAAFSGQKPPLSQNLGIPEDEMIIEPYLAHGAYRDGDLYLICSDGLTDMVTTEEIAETAAGAPVEEACMALLEKALSHGGKDNVTIILCRIERRRGWLFSRK